MPSLLPSHHRRMSSLTQRLDRPCQLDRGQNVACRGIKQHQFCLGTHNDVVGDLEGALRLVNREGPVGLASLRCWGN
jgi:hypothetical protein